MKKNKKGYECILLLTAEMNNNNIKRELQNINQLTLSKRVSSLTFSKYILSQVKSSYLLTSELSIHFHNQIFTFLLFPSTTTITHYISTLSAAC